MRECRPVGSHVGALEHPPAGAGIKGRGVSGVDRQRKDKSVGQAVVDLRPVGSHVGALEHSPIRAGIKGGGVGGVEDQRRDKSVGQAIVDLDLHKVKLNALLLALEDQGIFADA